MEKFKFNPSEQQDREPVAESENRSLEKAESTNAKEGLGSSREQGQDVSKKGIIKKISRNLALALGLIAAASGAGAEEKKKDDPFAEESLPKVARKNKPVEAIKGDRSVGAKNLDNVFVLTGNAGKDVDVLLQHNLRMPESLSDLGKMLVEPLSISISIPYGPDNIVAKVRTMVGGGDKEAEVVEIDIPYRYAQKFDTADPKNREKMQEEAARDAQKLFEKILTTTFGVSFFQKEAAEHHRQFSEPLTKVNNMRVKGYASPESTAGVNLGDIRNQKLSKLRAENAAETISELFKEKNIGVDAVYYQGKGELLLSPEHMKKLAAEAVKIDIAAPSDPQSIKVLDIIQKYNAHEIENGEATKLLEETVGAKRKVEIELEVSEEKKILVLPIPALLFFARSLIQSARRWREKSLTDKFRGLPHSFVRAEDPSRPTVKGYGITPEGKTELRDVDRLEKEANSFFRRYLPAHDSFFFVSGGDEDSLVTADAYRKAAQDRKFRVLRPENTRNDREDITNGFVRVLGNLSSEEGKEPEAIYEKEFKNLVRLLNFGTKKIEKADSSFGVIHVLAFGQGDIVVRALNKFFKENGMDNLEVIGLGGTQKPKKAVAEFRGKTKKIK